MRKKQKKNSLLETNRKVGLFLIFLEEFMQTLKYHRIMLKLGGESLSAAGGSGIDAVQAKDQCELAGCILSWDDHAARGSTGSC